MIAMTYPDWISCCLLVECDRKLDTMNKTSLPLTAYRLYLNHIFCCARSDAMIMWRKCEADSTGLYVNTMAPSLSWSISFASPAH